VVGFEEEWWTASIELGKVASGSHEEKLDECEKSAFEKSVAMSSEM